MLEINPPQQTERENYKLLIGSVVPRPIAFVTSEGEDGTLNGTPFSYFNVITADPAMLSLSVQRKKWYSERYNKEYISKGKLCHSHIVSKPYLEQMNKTAASLRPDESELTLAELTTIPSKQISTPGVKEAKVRYE